MKHDASAPVAGYTDGAAFDRVTYLKAKLILKPDQFTSVRSFRDFGRIVRETAGEIGVGFTKDRAAGKRPEIREIIFLDTPDFALYRNALSRAAASPTRTASPSAPPRSSASTATRTRRRPLPSTCVRGSTERIG